MPYEDKEDWVLMDLVKRGDKKAFGVLVRRYEKRVYNIAYKFLGIRSEAEDITQEVFLKIYEARKRYCPSAKWTTYLYKITVNMCLNKLREMKRFSSLLGGNIKTLPREKNFVAKKVAIPIEEWELRMKIKSAISSLPENQRMVVILTKYENLSYNEVAELMNLRVEAVKSLLFRAKDNLKRILWEIWS